MGFRAKNRRFRKYKNRFFERQRRRSSMENLVVNAEEHKMLKKYQKYLERNFNVRICMPYSKSQHSDVIFLSLEGAEYNRKHVKNFLANKMQESSKVQSPSQNNVPVITLSDSDSDLDSDLTDAGQTEKSNQTFAPKNIHDASIEPTNSSNLQTIDIPVSISNVSKKIHDVSICEIDSTSSSNLHTVNSHGVSVFEANPTTFMRNLTVKRRRGKKRKAKATKIRSSNEMSEVVDSSEISSSTDNSVVSKKAKLSDSVIIIEEPETSSKLCLDFIPFTSRTESANQVNEHAHKSLSSKPKNKINEPGTSKMVLDFIPLISGNGKINQNNKQAHRSSNSTSKDSNHTDKNDTIIIDESESTATPRRLRPIVIDGSNIAMEHGKTTHSFSVKGIKIAIDYFLKRGHTQVTAFIPKFRRNTNPNRNYPTTNGELLEEMENKQQIVFTPSRRINGKQISSYDDRFIVELAVSTGGVIVSNDNFRDLIGESETFKKVIEQRLLMFLFVGDVFMVPDDPLGRSGPRLIDYLSFLPEVENEEEKKKEEN